MKWKSEEEKLAWIREKLYTPVVSDTLDGLGLMHQAMRHDIRPLHPDFIVAGRARTLLWMATDDSWTVAPWGELLSTASKMRGATGTIVDAVVRDVKRIIAMGFPTFARGIMPLDSKGRGFVADIDVTIQCGGVEVRSGDLVFGDYDGIVVIPKAVEDEVLEQAYRKATSENHTRDELLRGRLLGEVYEKYGVL